MLFQSLYYFSSVVWHLEMRMAMLPRSQTFWENFPKYKDHKVFWKLFSFLRFLIHPLYIPNTCIISQWKTLLFIISAILIKGYYHWTPEPKGNCALAELETRPHYLLLSSVYMFRSIWTQFYLTCIKEKAQKRQVTFWKIHVAF